MGVYSLKPQDVLRLGGDSRQAAMMSARSPFVSWPLPSVIFSALHSALHRAFPQVTLWEHTHAYRRGADRRASNQRFGSLATAGPFPCLETSRGPAWFFIPPQDVLCEAGVPRVILAPNRDIRGRNNLPAPLRYGLVGAQVTTLTSSRQWWSKPALEFYLDSKVLDTAERVDPSEFYGVEHSARRDPVSRAHADEPPRNSVPSLRFCDGLSLGIAATLPLTEERNAEGMIRLLEVIQHTLPLGGQQRLCRVRPLRAPGLESLLPLSVPVLGQTVKWTLLSPAIFPALPAPAGHPDTLDHPGGWLPNWVCPRTGQVLLKKGRALRGVNESRADWRQRVRDSKTGFECQLVAACIAPPWVVTGWSARKHHLLNDASATAGPKRAWRAVPPGSVYYFEGPDAPELAAALAWHGAARLGLETIENRRSAVLGEAGFGLGVCGPWQFGGEN